MSIIKNILKYTALLLIVVCLLTLLLTLVAKIPTKYVEKNLKQATDFFEENTSEVKRIKAKREYTYLHPFADQVILNIIYCLDTDKPLESVLEAKYYTDNHPDGNNYKYIDLIENNLEGDTEYLRYWHGSIVIIKPLLMFFTLEQIYIFNAIALSILLIVLIAVLIKKRQLGIVISIVISLIMISFQYVPFTFEYVWTFYLMLIVSIISVIIENKENTNKKLNILFFITGIITCFLDFLTTEIITVLVPLVIIVSMRFKDNRIFSFKDEFIFIIKSMFLWFIGYAGMWLAKWCLAAIFLDINVIDAVKDSLINRVNGKVFDYSIAELMRLSIKRNFYILYPLILIKNKKWILTFIFIAHVVSFIMIFNKSKKENFKYLLLMIIIALIPYARYIVLSNHSYRHCFFVFRSQMPTIMSIILVFINCANKEKLFAQIK